MNTNALSNNFLLKRSIDLSLLRQGFHIPQEDITKNIKKK